MTTLKIHPSKKKNTEILGKVAYGVYHNMKYPQVSHHKQYPPTISNGDDFVLPPQPKTGIWLWCCACICAILTIFLILAGLIVLLVFLLFHPKLPHFDIVDARINSIFLDPSTYLMNAEMAFLVNITNTNHKVDLNYEYINFKLYFRNDLIGNQQLEPFRQSRMNRVFRDLEITSSDVELSPLNAQVLVSMAKQNKIAYKLLGTVRTKARFGSIAKVPYWLYPECLMVFSTPPNGTLLNHRCRTRR